MWFENLLISLSSHENTYAEDNHIASSFSLWHKACDVCLQTFANDRIKN